MVAAHAFVADLDAPQLDPDDRHHLERVLRLRSGEIVTVSDGRGGVRSCRFGPSLDPVGEVERVPAPSPPLTVAFAPTKGDRPEWAVQKLTEVGVDTIALLVTSRSVVRWDGGRGDRHVERLRRVAREASMQSRRVWLPEVRGPVPFAVLATVAGAAIAAPGGAPPDLAHPVVLVGPEGGWTDEELDVGLPRVGLGPTILRTETAAVAGGVLLCALRENLVAPKRE